MFRGEEEDLTSCLDVNEKESDSNGREVHLNGPMRKFELHHHFCSIFLGIIKSWEDSSFNTRFN